MNMGTSLVVRGVLYARGYLISRQDVAPQIAALKWAACTVGLGTASFHVYYDPRNDVMYRTANGRFVFLLGVTLDLAEKTMDMEKVADAILSVSADDGKTLDYLDGLCGRYIVICGTANRAWLVQDATGMRTCYYGKDFVASHYGLINDLERHPYINYWSRYCLMENRPWYLPGDQTPFQDVLTLMPNHRLDLMTHKIERIFPRKDRAPVSAEEAADYFIRTVQAQAEILAGRYQKVLLSATGGHDSRVSMAAFLPFREKALMFSYLNQSTTDSCLHDNIFARRFAEVFGFEFRQLPLDRPTPGDLVNILRRNHYHEHIPRAIPAYLTGLPCEGAIHVRSNVFETIRERHFFMLSECTAQEMLRIVYGWRGEGENPLVRKAFDDYFVRNGWTALHGYDAGDLYFMELRMGVWHAGGVLLASDIAFDTYCLYNQRRLLDLGMSIPMRFRRSNFLVDRALRVFCPEMGMNVPNSDETLLNRKSPFSKTYCPCFKTAEATAQGAECYSTLAPEFAEVAFASGDIKKGAFVGVRLSFDRVPVGSGVTVVLSFLPLAPEIASAFTYKVLVNGEPRISESVASLDDGCVVLQVGLKEKVPVSSVEVQTVATKDFACLDAVPVMRLANWLVINEKVSICQP